MGLNGTKVSNWSTLKLQEPRYVEGQFELLFKGICYFTCKLSAFSFAFCLKLVTFLACHEAQEVT
jgi:hypothetical protein